MIRPDYVSNGLILIAVGRGGCYFGIPPFDPCPSQYACPFPSIIAPGADVIVTFFPPIVIGLNVEELVNAKVVNPANVTTELAFRLARLILLLVGTAMPSNVIAVQAATAGAICEYTVAVHVVPVDVAVELELEDVVVELEDEELEEVVLEIEVDVEDAELEEVVLDTAVKRHEHAVDTLDGRFEHWVA